jgi:hypothetical protein
LSEIELQSGYFTVREQSWFQCRLFWAKASMAAGFDIEKIKLDTDEKNISTFEQKKKKQARIP